MVLKKKPFSYKKDCNVLAVRSVFLKNSKGGGESSSHLFKRYENLNVII